MSMGAASIRPGRYVHYGRRDALQLGIDLQRIAWITSFRWTWITPSYSTSLFWITTRKVSIGVT